MVIRQRDLGEADRILSLLTRERGKLSAVARGVKRPRSKLAGGLQLFCQSDLQLAAGRSLEVVTQVRSTDTFHHLRDDLTRYAHACYMCELVDALTEEGSPDAAVFDLVSESLRALNGGSDPATVTRGFELKLMSHMGYGPELEGCVACGAEVMGDGAGFSAPEGGALCAACRRAWRATGLGASALGAMRDLLRLPVSELARRRLTAAVGDELARMMRAYVDYRVDRPLRSTSFLAP